MPEIINAFVTQPGKAIAGACAVDGAYCFCKESPGSVGCGRRAGGIRSGPFFPAKGDGEVSAVRPAARIVSNRQINKHP